MTAKRELDGIKVAILVTDGFEQIEMTKPRDALIAAGAETVIVSPKAGKVQGVHHGKPGDTFSVDLTLHQADPSEFDAALLPGGVMNADHLRVEKRAQEFIRKIDEENKPIAVICHGGWLLVSSGLVKGRILTSYHTIQDDIRNAGGDWRDQEVVLDDNWVSSRKPDDLPAFDREMIRMFAERKARMEDHSTVMP